MVIEGMSVAKAIEMSLHENLERELLNPSDEAEAFLRLTLEGIHVSEIAANFGRDERFVNQRMKIAELPAWVKAGVFKEDITLGTAQVLTSATKAQLKSLAVEFKASTEQFLFSNASSMRRHLNDNSSIRADVALFNLEEAGILVIKNLFDDEFDGTIIELDKFWDNQMAWVHRAASKYQEEGHEVHIFERDKHYPRHHYQPSKAKQTIVVMDVKYDGSIEITEQLKLSAERNETAAKSGTDTDTAEPDVKGDLTKKVMLEMNELRSMSVAHAIALGSARGYITQAANALTMFGPWISSNSGNSHSHQWNEDLAAEHENFQNLEDTAQGICTILEISVREGDWALNVIANPMMGKCDIHQTIYNVMNMEKEEAEKLQGILVASKTVLVADRFLNEADDFLVDIVGSFLEDELEDGFSANQDWELNERTIDSIRNRNALEHLLMLCGESSSDGFIAGYDSKTKISDLKKLLINYTASSSGRKSPWLSWLDFPAKQLG